MFLGNSTVEDAALVQDRRPEKTFQAREHFSMITPTHTYMPKIIMTWNSDLTLIYVSFCGCFRRRGFRSGGPLETCIVWGTQTSWHALPITTIRQVSAGQIIVQGMIR